jgi:hypothetical protein
MLASNIGVPDFFSAMINPVRLALISLYDVYQANAVFLIRPPKPLLIGF